MKVVIVGGTTGGVGTATGLRRNDEQTEIIMLGRGSYISCADCGLPYYIGGVITEREALQLQTPEGFGTRFHVGVRTMSKVAAVDTVRKCVVVKHGGETYEESYDKLVLSPGAGPVRPGVPGMEKNHVFIPGNIPDIYAVHDYITKHDPVSCAVIGAGFTGLEMAGNLAEQDLKVPVVGGASHVMPPIDMDVAHGAYSYIRSKGIDLYLGQTCTTIDGSGVILKNDARVPADMVTMSIGVHPDTGFLKDSGIKLGARGEIIVNTYMETSTADIYVLGDAVSVEHMVSGQKVLIPLASPANKQGRIVGDNLCRKKTAYKGSRGTSVMKFSDVTVAVTGEKERSLGVQEGLYCKTITTSASQAGYYPGDDMMTIKTLFDPETAVILGAQVVGGRGMDKRIGDLADAVRFKLTGYDLQEMELAYAPSFSSVKDPVNMAGYVISNIVDGLIHPFCLEDLDQIPEGVIRLDVRTEGEYTGGTIPGFINIPLDSLRDRTGELDLSKGTYITYQIGLRGCIVQRILDQAGARTWNMSDDYRFYEMKVRDEQSQATGMGLCTACGMEKTTLRE